MHLKLSPRDQPMCFRIIMYLLIVMVNSVLGMLKIDLYGNYTEYESEDKLMMDEEIASSVVG